MAVGYSSHLERVLGTLTFKITSRVVPGYAELTPKGSQIRANVLGVYFFGSIVLSVCAMELWLRSTNPAGGVVIGKENPNKAGAKGHGD